MAKIELINPPLGVKKRYGKFGEAGSVVPPLGLCYIAAVLEKCGHTVGIIDGELSCESPEDVLKFMGHDTDAVGITSSTMGISTALRTAEIVKSWDDDIPIIIGGPHVSALPAETMSRGLFDFGVIGEGENTIVELIDRLGDDPYGIDGIAYSKNGEVVINRMRNAIKNLDDIPFPARHLLPDLRLYRPNAQNYKRLPTTTMITSRGCPYGCIFCDKAVFGRTYRTHSPEYVVNEMEMLISKYKINEVWLIDDTFTLNNKRVEDICGLIIDRGLDISWSCLGQVNTVNPKMLNMMAKAGCWLISYGIESGNQNVLDYIQKNITLKQVKNAIEWSNNVGIETKGFFMLAHPIDTIKTIDDTINFAKSLSLDQAIFTVTTPLPNTKLYDYAIENKLLSAKEWSSFSMLNPTFIPNGLTEDILKNKLKEGYHKFYFRLGYITRQIFKTRSLSDLNRKIIGLRALLSL